MVYYYIKGAVINKVKINVLKMTLYKELAEEYGAVGFNKFPMHTEGQIFYADYAKSDNFCDEAWKAIYQYIFTLGYGAESTLFYYMDWIREPEAAVCVMMV